MPSGHLSFGRQLLRQLQKKIVLSQLWLMSSTTPTELLEDVYGLPGDLLSNVPQVLLMLSCLMDENSISWCVVGDMLLAH
jgi:hypothetical protein